MIEKFEAKGELGSAMAVGHEAEVADAYKAWRQDMQQEASQEFVYVQSHNALLIVVC